MLSAKPRSSSTSKCMLTCLRVRVQDFDRRKVPTRGLDDVLVDEELKAKLDKVSLSLATTLRSCTGTIHHQHLLTGAGGRHVC